MKIKYEFVTGEVTEVEVEETVGTFILDSRKKEHADNERARYHRAAVEADSDFIKEIADKHTPESLFEQAQNNEVLYKALSTLTEKQLKRLLLYSEGMSYREIARLEKVSDHKVIIDSIEQARKKLKKFL